MVRNSCCVVALYRSSTLHTAGALTEALTLAQTHRLLAEAVLVAVAAGVGERMAVVSRRVVEEEGEIAVT